MYLMIYKTAGTIERVYKAYRKKYFLLSVILSEIFFPPTNNFSLEMYAEMCVNFLV